MKIRMSTRASRLSCVVATLLTQPFVFGCHASPRTQPPAAVALSSFGEQLYVAQGDTLRSLPLTRRKGLTGGDPRSLGGPCSEYVDLDVWEGDLFALCSDGQIFRQREPEHGGQVDADAWTSVEIEAVVATALQRSDAMLLAVTPEGGLTPVAARAEVSPEHSIMLDRFRGPARGGPNEVGVASFVAFEGWSVHALSLRRGPEIVARTEAGELSCSLRLPGALVHDLSLAEFSSEVAAVVIDRRGRSRLVLAHPRANWVTGFAGVFELPSGRRAPLSVRCKQL